MVLLMTVTDIHGTVMTVTDIHLGHHRPGAADPWRHKACASSSPEHPAGSAPPSATPIEAVARALDAVGAVFADRREFARVRQAVIGGSAELQERELIKLATLSAAVADALRARGVGDPAAGLTGEVAVAVFKVAFGQWVVGPGTRDLSQLMRDGLDQLKSVTAGT